MLIIEAINVKYQLRGVAAEDAETVARVHEFHADYCPVARSVRDCISITTEYELLD